HLHPDRPYRVEPLDLADAYALLAAVEVDEYTQPRHDIDIAITGEERSRPVGRSTLHLGAVEVTTTTDAYQRRRIGSGEVLDTVELDLPPRTLSTRAGWYTVPVEVVLGAGLGLRGRLPVVRPVSEVRQLERVPRQAGGRHPDAGDAVRRSGRLSGGATRGCRAEPRRRPGG